MSEVQIGDGEQQIKHEIARIIEQFAQDMAEIQDHAINLQEIVEDLAGHLGTQRRYDEALDRFTTLVNRHDLTYLWSDDPQARQRGAVSYTQITTLARDLAVEDVQRIWNAMADRQAVDSHRFYWHGGLRHPDQAQTTAAAVERIRTRVIQRQGHSHERERDQSESRGY